MKRATAAGALALAAVFAGCNGVSVAPTPPPGYGGGGVPLATEQTFDELTPDPGAGGETQTYKVGDVIMIDSNDEPWAQITITRPSVHKSYSTYDKPQTKGYVFIQALVTYKALANGVTYNPFDWEVFAGDEAVQMGFAVDGPNPELSSGTLSKGRTAKGWVIYEVPPKGKVVMSYGGGYGGAPVFEVVIRGS